MQSRVIDDKLLKVTERVHKLFKKRKITLSVAESCTGGLISHHITAVPGASSFFEGGIVSYSVELKRKLLGVPQGIIKKYGVVSEETAKEMAKKIRLLTGTDYSVSTTGNLGPDVLEGKERGLIYIAVSKKGQVFSKRLRLKDGREFNKKTASLLALKFLIDVVQGKAHYV